MPQSPLHNAHLELGGRMVSFAGWEMPIQYQGIVAEHHAVRKGVGVFDISHMGEVEISGTNAEAWLNTILTNDVSQLGDGDGQYTLLLNESGGVIDDLILYRLTAERFFLVVNAARIDEDVAWLSDHLEGDVALLNRSPEFGALAIQGPDSVTLWEKVGSEFSLPERNGIASFENGLILCRTGYTGEDGFELFAPTGTIEAWFRNVLEAGAVPCGLGARDTLRLEKGYPLNGSDLDENHTPLEAGLGFFVKLEKEASFPGKQALLSQKEKGLNQKLTAIQMTGKAPPIRHGYGVLDSEGNPVGELASGSLSPNLGLGIGMAYLPIEFSRIGTPLSVEVRGKSLPAETVKKPFV